MIGLDGSSRVLEDEILILDHAIRREAPFALPQAHRAPAGVEADADLLRRPDLVVNAAVVGVDVEVVGRGGATGEHQFGQSHQRTGVDRLRGQPGPDGVESLEPLKQRGVLRSRHGAGQGLVEVVVSINQPWQDNHPPGVEDAVGLGRQFGGRSHLLDDVVTHEQAAIGDAPPVVTHRRQQVGVFQK